MTLVAFAKKASNDSVWSRVIASGIRYRDNQVAVSDLGSTLAAVVNGWPIGCKFFCTVQCRYSAARPHHRWRPWGHLLNLRSQLANTHGPWFASLFAAP
jgi:hypothetical protein